MATDAQIIATAKDYYVKDLMSPRDIARKVKKSEPTIRNWMKEGKWEEARKEEQQLNESLLIQAKKITYHLGQQITNLIDSKNEVQASLYTSYSKMLSTIKLVKEIDEKEKSELVTVVQNQSLKDKTKHALHKIGFLENVEDEL